MASTYCDRDDIENVFGTTNVAEWGDLDDTDVAADITARIEQAIAVAGDRIDDVLRASGYSGAIPVLTAAGATPTTITDLAATLAGLWLYEARGCKDFNPTTGAPYHRLAFKRLEARRALEDIRTRQRVLDVRGQS